MTALFCLALAAALGSGLIAGVFFAFSSFVMPALARLPESRGIAAMQSMNVMAVRPWFLAAFLGTAAACGLLVIAALRDWERPGSTYLFVGGLLYLLGPLLVTAVCNVPRNNRLNKVDPASAGAAEVWVRYVREWTAWNHVRTAAGLAGAGTLIGGLLKLS